MELIILRHGEAGNRVPTASQDGERSLTVSGKEEVDDVARSMVELKLKFDLIATSPLKRSIETAKIVAKRFKKEKTLEVWEELRPEGESRSLYRRLSKLKQDSSVLIVGHEPYLSSVISEITAGKRGAHIALKKAGIAKVEVNSLSPVPDGELRWLLTPKLLKKVS